MERSVLIKQTRPLYLGLFLGQNTMRRFCCRDSGALGSFILDSVLSFSDKLNSGNLILIMLDMDVFVLSAAVQKMQLHPDLVKERCGVRTLSKTMCVKTEM
ncbi:hypothetical protein ILYODFUR_039078 [Ilyodon furcidens]|uniref:Uncharacterized protein n=1 Tax=Ilyodon furcidens TaxID=33524 RepID=A0ABV0SVF2_9TELE